LIPIKFDRSTFQISAVDQKSDSNHVYINGGDVSLK